MDMVMHLEKGTGKYTFDDLYKRFRLEVRNQIKSEMAVVGPEEEEAVAALKREAVKAFDEGQPEVEILETYSKQLALVDPKKPITLTKNLFETRSEQERAATLEKLYCSVAFDAPPQTRRMKEKYASHFVPGRESGDVLTQWRAEALRVQSEEMGRLEHRLSDLRMAQSAHLKNQVKKREREQRILEREQVEKKQRRDRETAACGKPGCGRQINLVTRDAVLVCVLCEWLVDQAERLGDGDVPGKRDHVYYCSEEHAGEHFVRFPPNGQVSLS
jgi:hypothetical protein